MSDNPVIAQVRTHLLSAPLRESFAYSRAWYDRRTAMLVEIVTDTGITGWGECYGPAAMTEGVVRALTSALIGRDALSSERIFSDLYGLYRDHGQKGLLVEALSGIDIALWDIKGKHFDVPAYVLLGGPMRTDVAAYATGLYRRRDGDPMIYLPEEAAAHAEAGFGAVKLKAGFGVAADVAAAHAVREAIGDEVGLMVDANHAYDVVAAQQLGRAIEPLGIGWFEEPVPPEDIAGYRRLRESLTIPIAGGECEYTRLGFRNLFVAGALDIAQPDVCAAGGLGESKKIADLAATFGIRCNPHVWGSGIGLAASLQLLASIAPHSHSALVPVEPLLEFDMTEHPIRQAILRSPIEPVKGRVAVPSGPGLGIEVDRDAVEGFKS